MTDTNTTQPGGWRYYDALGLRVRFDGIGCEILWPDGWTPAILLTRLDEHKAESYGWHPTDAAGNRVEWVEQTEKP